MKTVFLFPAKFKVIGWGVLVPSILIGVYLLINPDTEWSALDWRVPWLNDKDNFLNELIMILVLISAILVAFSKTKEEDEYVQRIRLDSLVWSMYLNSVILFIGIIGAYGFQFLNVLVLNAYTPLFIFIIRFQYYFAKR